MKNLIIIAIIIIVAVVALLPTLRDNSFDIDKYLQQAKAERKLVMLELSSATCSTCKRMQPYLAQIKEEYPNKVAIKIIDIAIKTEIAKKFQVTAIPTQIFIDKEGKQYFKHVGYLSKSDILKIFKQKGL
jgi:thioredoxin 1